MTQREILELRWKLETDPILTDGEIESILNAIERQHPVKVPIPVPVKPVYDHRYAEMGCAFCGNSLGGWEESPDYCPRCGQAIDWED